MIYGGIFDVDKKKEHINELDKEINKSDFWDDTNKAQEIIKELNEYKDLVNNISNLRNKINDNIELLDMVDDKDLGDLEKDTLELVDDIDELNLLLLFNGPYDKNNCIVDIHSGAGGTEACDWANMLYRMYTRWCEKKGFKIEVLDYQAGEEAGIKSVSFLVKGTNAYGLLKNEKGVHRLVRLSPFDSNNRRHTSFASLEVTPDIKLDNSIEIDEKDIKIDVYRSSGAGGQGVNTTDSAVRITHLPTKIVVTCQNERSQIQNKETALNILKSKLLLIKLEEQEKQLKNITGEQMGIDFGSQIRSYVMHPYSMVKDHRTNTETSDVNGVLDGDIDKFIEDNLKNNLK